MASAKLERMFRVTELDHPERATYRWTKLEREGDGRGAATRRSVPLTAMLERKRTMR